MLLSTSVIMPRLPYSCRSYFVTYCSCPFSSLNITDTMPVLLSREGCRINDRKL